MIYGLYLSATGVMTSEYKQDVTANNLANSETTGFKRDIPAFRQRLAAAQEGRTPGAWSDSVLDGLGGGLFVEPDKIDLAQGDMENTGAPLDAAIQGSGFFAVDEAGKTQLTRDGRFNIDQNGFLTLTSGQKVLNPAGSPINIAANVPTTIDKEGNLMQGGQAVGKIGVFEVADKSKLTKLGGGLLDYPDRSGLTPSTSLVHSEFLERSNVDPTTELTELMDAQRQLEANANMIRTQDSTLELLVTSVGKIT